MLLSSLVLSLALAPTTYAQTFRSAFPVPREYRMRGLQRFTADNEDDSLRVCLIRKADKRRVCKTRTDWEAEAAAIGPSGAPSEHNSN